MRRALLFCAWLVGCAASEAVAPVVELPAPGPPPSSSAALPAPAVEPPAAAPLAQVEPPLRRFDDLSQRVLWAWVSEKEAAQLAADPKALLRRPAPALAPPYGLTARLSTDDAEKSDDWSALLARRGLAARRLAWPNLAGAVLLREPYAFVPVRVTLRAQALVLDHELRFTRQLDGQGVPREQATARAGELGALFAKHGRLRAYVLVNPAMIESVEVGTSRVQEAFAEELRLLEAYAAELDAVERAGVSFATLPLLDRLRAGAVEPNAGWDVGERIEAMRALAGVTVKPWSKELGAPGKVDLQTRQAAPGHACKRLYHPGRKLAADEWCGTGAMAYHYCSEGCAAGPASTCVPVAEAWK